MFIYFGFIYLIFLYFIVYIKDRYKESKLRWGRGAMIHIAHIVDPPLIAAIII
jgi:hypothetical protein